MRKSVVRATEEIENIPEDESFKKIPILSVSTFLPHSPSSSLSYLFNFSSIYPFILVLGEEKMLVSFLALLETENKLRLTELCLPYYTTFLPLHVRITFAPRPFNPIYSPFVNHAFYLTSFAEIHSQPKLNFILFFLFFLLLFFVPAGLRTTEYRTGFVDFIDFSRSISSII